MSENTGYPRVGAHTENLVGELARDVLAGDEEPSELLKTALEQLIGKVLGKNEPERPVDWASVVQESVQARKNYF